MSGMGTSAFSPARGPDHEPGPAGGAVRRATPALRRLERGHELTALARGRM